MCDLQPQTRCTIITKPLPHLKLVPNCYTEEKEVCRKKQGEARPAGKQTLVKWCEEPDVRTKTNLADPLPLPAYPGDPLPAYGFTVSHIVQERKKNYWCKNNLWKYFYYTLLLRLVKSDSIFENQIDQCKSASAEIFGAHANKIKSFISVC